MVVVSAELPPVVQQIIQQGQNTLQGLVGPLPQAAEELRRRYLGWRDEAERVLRSLAGVKGADLAVLDSARHRDLVKDMVPDDQLWREIRSERDAIITALETAVKGAAPAEELVGADGARYRWDLSQRLGGGSYGQVYRGTAADGTEVAVKVVPIRTDSATRWVGDTLLTERELLVLRRLGPHNPNLLPLLDATLSDDQLVLVMPLAGPSLAEAIRSAPLDEARVRALVLDVARGLQQLAPHGVVHRDIAPGNILRWNDRWVLGDFGVARIVQDATAPYTWAMTGTREYWAPELFRGGAATVQSDLYAVGCVAVEALTGRKAFTGDDLARAHSTELPPIPDLTDPALGRVISDLLAKDPAGRPTDARRVIEMLSPTLSLAADQQGLQRLAATASARALEAGRRDAVLHELTDRRKAAAAALDRLWRDVADRAREAVPDARATTADLITRFLELGYARLTVQVAPPAQADHPLLLVGLITVHAAPGAQPTHPLNAICTSSNGRPHWELVSFTPNDIALERIAVGPSRNDRRGSLSLDQLGRLWPQLNQKPAPLVTNRESFTAAKLIAEFVAEVEAGPAWT